MTTDKPDPGLIPMEDIACNPGHIPEGNGYVRHPNVARWLQELGEKYMKKVNEDQPGLAVPDVQYKFDRLPYGYSLWVKDRSDGTGRDKYLYGHPQCRRFASLVQFVEHLFHHLYHRRPANNCPCTTCNPRATASTTATTGAQTTPQTPIGGSTTGVANITTGNQPPTMSAAAFASAPPPPPGAVVYGCALPPGSWGAMPPNAPHGPAWYDDEREKLMKKLKPELHIYDTHMPGKKCEWCPPVSTTDYCTCCRRHFYVRGADTTLPHYEGQ